MFMYAFALIVFTLFTTKAFEAFLEGIGQARTSCTELPFSPSNDNGDDVSEDSACPSKPIVRSRAAYREWARSRPSEPQKLGRAAYRRAKNRHGERP